MPSCRSSASTEAISSRSSSASPAPISAVHIYLDIYGLRSDVDVISARENADVSLLKPNPFLLLEAAAKLNLPIGSCVLIGDSGTDIQASRAVNAAAIGYANKPGKRHDLATFGPDAIVSDLGVIVSSLDPGCCR
jgi:beta-phosphoglucomutase-like phosphatase (HAD superfamily)